MSCITNCLDEAILGIPDNTVCDDYPVRNGAIATVGLLKCDTPLPNPLTCTALADLIDDGLVVFSPSLANVAFAEPQFDEVLISDCSPRMRRIVQRTMTFDDKHAIKIPEITGETPVPARNFFDREFWGNKRKMSMSLRYLLVYCDGNVEVPRDDNGTPMTATLTVYRDFDRNTVGDSENIIEVKRVQIDFKGDPLELREPELNINEADCADIRNKVIPV